MTDDEKKWIDNATYEQLLKRWRFASVADDIFQGDTGIYYAEVMAKRRAEVGVDEAAAVSKRIGWGR